MFRIVLFEPEIPPNTGNVIRLCANTGAELHLVRPLGFDVDRRAVRRAGLDYRWMAAVQVHDDFAACRAALTAAGARRWFAVETGGTRRYDEIDWQPGDVMLFGSEGRGLPPELVKEFAAGTFGADEAPAALPYAAPVMSALASIPMLEGNRSLNLSNSVSLVLYEAWRQNGFAAAADLSRTRP